MRRWHVPRALEITRARRNPVGIGWWHGQDHARGTVPEPQLAQAEPHLLAGWLAGTQDDGRRVW